MNSNVYANLLFLISAHENDAELFKKAIDSNNNEFKLTQQEIDELLEKHKDKSFEINKAFLSANAELLKDNDPKESLLFLINKYFGLNGLTDVFFTSFNQPKNRIRYLQNSW